MTTGMTGGNWAQSTDTPTKTTMGTDTARRWQNNKLERAYQSEG